MRLITGLLAAFVLACAGPPPIISQQTFAATSSGLFEKVAVVPFYPTERLVRTGTPEGVSAAQAADLVARFVTEELDEKGVVAVAPNDVLIAFEGLGQVVPRQDSAAVAALVAREFGATSLLTGRVNRYREREGGASGAIRPASSGFELTLYSAPEGERIWVGRFEETQHSITGNIVRARQYPGGGTRWLTVAELTRWGVERAIDAVPAGVR